MPDWDQIVIGRGTSALTFLNAAFHGTQTKFVHRRTLIIGKGAAQLWKKIEGNTPKHQMGQPEHLLRPSGLQPDPGLQGGHGQFIETKDYNKLLGQLETKINTERNKAGTPLVWSEENVTGIFANANDYRVVTDLGTAHTAKQVIVASGAGKGKTMAAIGVKVEGPAKDEVGTSGEYLDAVDYMIKMWPKGKKVLVYGSSASSSWAVAHAFANSASQVMWGCRSGINGITKDGNPVGRNSEIIKRAVEGKMIQQCEIDTITALGGLGAMQGRLRVQFKNNTPEPIDFDQVVYAVGADPVEELGPGGILKGDLPGRMIPVWDHNYRFALSEDQKAITALKDSAGNLWVVGAAVFRGLGIKALEGELASGGANRYAKIGEVLCGGGRPPEGIAIVDTSINAVTGFRQTDVNNFNWNKANRRDIFPTAGENLSDGHSPERAREDRR